MEQLSKKERYDIYSGVLEKNIKSTTFPYPSGLCYELLEYNNEFNSLHSTDALEMFPEFALFQPEKILDSPLWFGDNSCGNINPDEVRHTVLMFCIEMTR